MKLPDPQTLVLFITFIVVVVLLYKTIKFLMRLVLVAAISFSFPWISTYLHLPVSVEPTFDNALHFMLLGVGLFILFEIL